MNDREPGPLKYQMKNHKATKPDIVDAGRIEEVKDAPPSPLCHECGTPMQNGSGTPQHLRCPSCHGGRGGVGIPKWHTRVSGTLVRRCYVCNICGFDWTVNERVHREIVSVEHAEVTVQNQPGPNLETRGG